MLLSEVSDIVVQCTMLREWNLDTHFFFLTSIVLEGGSSNRISIRGAHRGDRLLNPGIPRPREVGSLLSFSILRVIPREMLF
jgi:hypothetical protein